MDRKILNFLNKERVGVLTVVLADGSLHGAAVHYSVQIEPLKISIQTSNDTVKVQPFLARETGQAAFVVGFSEVEWLTLQMRGEIKMVTDPAELEKIYQIHYAKNPKAEQYKGLDTVFLQFTPTWWRYTDFNTNPETIIEVNCQD